MAKFEIGPNKRIDVVLPDSPEDLRHETILVLLEQLNVRRLFSKDVFKGSREGTLAVSVGDQVTSLSWSRRKQKNAGVKNPQKFEHYVLFLGKPDVNLDFSVHVVETDKNTVKGLKKANAALTGANAIANLVPGAGAAVSASLNMLGAILDFIKGQVDDDTELCLHASMTQESPRPDGRIRLKKGTYKIIRKATDPRIPPDIEVHLGVYNFRPLPESHDQDVLVVLDSITFKLPPLNPDNPNLEQRTLVFDATVGGGEDATRFDFRGKIRNGKASIDNVTGLKDKVLYQGPWNIGVPFTFSLAAVRDSDELEALEGLIDTTSKRAKRFTTKKPVQQTVDKATKALQSIRALMIEFLPEKFSIGTKSGLIVDASSIVDPDLTPSGDPAARKLYLLTNLSNDTWTAVSIVLRNAGRISSATVNLKIKYLPNAQSVGRNRS